MSFSISMDYQAVQIGLAFHSVVFVAYIAHADGLDPLFKHEGAGTDHVRTAPLVAVVFLSLLGVHHSLTDQVKCAVGPGFHMDNESVVILLLKGGVTDVCGVAGITIGLQVPFDDIGSQLRSVMEINILGQDDGNGAVVNVSDQFFCQVGMHLTIGAITSKGFTAGLAGKSMTDTVADFCQESVSYSGVAVLMDDAAVLVLFSGGSAASTCCQGKRCSNSGSTNTNNLDKVSTSQICLGNSPFFNI